MASCALFIITKVSIKVFNNKQQLDNYFENQPYAMLAEFYQEEDLDAFLLNYKS
jgi:hypothetical protein